MNLHYDPSMLALHNLISNGQQTLNQHNIVVDFDGEVIIDPELHYPNVELNRYMFHTCVTPAIKQNARGMDNLLKTLMGVIYSDQASGDNYRTAA